MITGPRNRILISEQTAMKLREDINPLSAPMESQTSPDAEPMAPGTLDGAQDKKPRIKF